MNYQETLSGKQKIDCCEPCMNATGDKCECRCMGANHGLGKPKDFGTTDPYLTTTQAENFKCADVCQWGNCKGELGDIQYYPHSSGWKVDGIPHRVWLYKVCLKCGYQWALWKLGVPR